jgi:hypothetical protein
VSQPVLRGRSTEIERATTALCIARSESRGTVLAVTGESGMGKSSLLASMRDRCAQRRIRRRQREGLGGRRRRFRRARFVRAAFRPTAVVKQRCVSRSGIGVRQSVMVRRCSEAKSTLAYRAVVARS